MHNTKTIFISRHLSTDSIFLNTLAPLGFNIIGESLVEFKIVKFDTVPASDWLFFYSKNGVKFFFEQRSPKIQLPQLATIGESTANYLKEQYNLEVNFVGNGQPEQTAEQFLPLAKSRTITFVQATNSKQSVQLLLGQQITSNSLVVYQNAPKIHVQNPEADILVFTSPMNVESYFQQFEYSTNLSIITIGKTTAKALEKIGIQEYCIADATNETALAKKVLELHKY